MPLVLKERSILPGFNLTLGITLTYLSLIVLIPLSMLVWKTMDLSLVDFWKAVASERAVASYKISFGTALVAAAINVPFGLLLAWVLVRYRFPGRRLIDGFIDLPFALPTAVAGITLAMIYGPNGWIGQWLAAVGIQAVYNPLGITIALLFIGLPFIVRTVQPVLENLGTEYEEAAGSLGASRLYTFKTIIFPEIWPALAAGFALAFARGVGEYGSVVFIAGNHPYVSEITPLLIYQKLEQGEESGATAIALVMLLLSFIMLIAISLLQRLVRARGM